jgi:mRNA interferase MazF
VVAPATGAVVLVRFPFSDQSQTKLRPAVVLADVGRDDWILGQVTSKLYGDPATMVLEEAAFASGSFAPLAAAAPLTRPGALPAHLAFTGATA